MQQPTLGLDPPPRRMPSLLDVARYWLDQADELPDYEGRYIGLGEPFCAACGWLAPLPLPDFSWDRDGGAPMPVDDAELERRWRFAGRFLDRAHLVDHMYDGSSEAGNLLPLCRLCHAEQPSSRIGDRAKALAWVRAHPRRPSLYQLVTDEVTRQHPDAVRELSGPASRSFLRKLYVLALEHLVATKKAASEVDPEAADEEDASDAPAST